MIDVIIYENLGSMDISIVHAITKLTTTIIKKIAKTTMALNPFLFFDHGKA